MFTGSRRNSMDRSSDIFFGIKVDRRFSTDESLADRSTLAGDSSPANTISRQTSCSSEDIWDSVRDSFFQVDGSKTMGKPRQFKKVVDAPVEANLPADFGMAWNAAKHVGVGKRVMREGRSRGFTKGFCQKMAQPATTEGRPLCRMPGLVPSEVDECVKGIPLPKFAAFRPPQTSGCGEAHAEAPAAATMQKGLSMPPRSSVAQPGPSEQAKDAEVDCTTETSGEDSEDECTGILMTPRFYIAVPITAFQAHCTKVNPEQPAPLQMKETEAPPPALCEEPWKINLRDTQEPLKIDIPSLSNFSAVALHPGMPCKRRMPEWSL